MTEAARAVAMHMKNAVEGHRVRLFLVAVCLLLAVIEWLVADRPSTVLDLLLSVFYIVVLLALVPFPTCAAIVLCLLSGVLDLLPVVINGVSSYWGTWVAIAVLAGLGRPVLLLCCVAFTCLGAVWSGVHQPDMTVPGVFFLTSTYVIAALSGFAVMKWRETVQLRHDKEIADRQLSYDRSRLNMVREIHDSVAGSLSYAVLRMRMMQQDYHSDAKVSGDLDEIERVMRQALEELRRFIRGSQTQLMLKEPGDRGHVEEEAAADVSMSIVQNALRDIKQHLQSLHFHGDVRLDCQSADTIVNAQVISIAQELSRNIAKYGDSQSSYALLVSVCGDGEVTLFSSNCCAAPTTQDSSMSSGLGLEDMQAMVTECGGEIDIANEDNEWTVYISLPRE